MLDHLETGHQVERPGRIRQIHPVHDPEFGTLRARTRRGGRHCTLGDVDAHDASRHPHEPDGPVPGVAADVEHISTRCESQGLFVCLEVHQAQQMLSVRGGRAVLDQGVLLTLEPDHALRFLGHGITPRFGEPENVERPGVGAMISVIRPGTRCTALEDRGRLCR